MTDISETFIESYKNGSVCLHPAGTLYGLTCDPFSEIAMKRVYEIKQRPRQKPLIYLSSSYEKALNFWDNLPGLWAEALKEVWPEHLTVLWRVKAGKSQLISHTDSLIGIRVPRYDEPSWFERVLQKLDHPTPTTSINYSGTPSLRLRCEVTRFCRKHQVFFFEKDGGLDAPENSLLPSTIIKIADETSYKLVRNGAFDHQHLSTFGLKFLKNGDSE